MAQLLLTVEQRAELCRRVGAAPTSEWAAGMPWAAISDSMRFDIARAGPRTGCRTRTTVVDFVIFSIVPDEL